MNQTEAVKLCRLVRALCPTQTLDEHTPAAWAIVMDDVRYEDAQQAVRTIYRERGNDQEWGGRRVEADDIIREVRRIRERRLDEHGPVEPPADLSIAEYQTWLRNARKAVADGQTIGQPALTQRDMTALSAIDKRLA